MLKWEHENAYLIWKNCEKMVAYKLEEELLIIVVCKVYMCRWERWTREIVSYIYWLLNDCNEASHLSRVFNPAFFCISGIFALISNYGNAEVNTLKSLLCISVHHQQSLKLLESLSLAIYLFGFHMAVLRKRHTLSWLKVSSEINIV